MAKKKTTKVKTDEDLIKELAATTGGEILSETGPPYFVDTGNLAVNFICSGRFIDGGIPGGRVTEVYGPSSSAKSLLATCVLHGAEKLNAVTIYFDVENALNKDFAASAGHVDISKILRFGPKDLPTIEKVFRKMYNIVRKVRAIDKDRPVIIIYDSIAVSPCEREFAEINLPDEFTEAEFKRIVKRHEQPGERAKACNKEFRKVLPVLEEQNITLFIVNQVRDKIGDLWESEVTAGGGNALPYYASLRLRTQAYRKILNKFEYPIGVNVKIQNKKNRSNRPMLETKNIPLYFDKGINPVGGLLSILLQTERIKSPSAGNYVVCDPYADGKDVKFKSSKERNDVPVSLLLECPAVIDATSKKEVEDYLRDWGSAIDQSLEDANGGDLGGELADEMGLD